MPLIGGVTAADTDAWAWATGERPLALLGGDCFSPRSGPDAEIFRVQDAPHRSSAHGGVARWLQAFPAR